MRTGHRAVALAVIVAFYLTLVGPRASLLLQSEQRFGRLVAVGVFLVPLVVVWFIWRETRFERATARLGAELESLPGAPVEPESVYDGPIDHDRADLVFAARRLAVESAPQDWAAWYRLGMAYDAVGDRSSGRAAMRQAVALRARSR